MSKRDNGLSDLDLSVELPAVGADTHAERVYVGNCAFAFVCSKRWGDLEAYASSPDKRFCGTCKKDVNRCYSTDEFARRGRAGECVAIVSLSEYSLPSIDEDVIMGLPSSGDDEYDNSF
jgi:hypothetical protein